MPAPTFATTDVLGELRRELALRQRVYPAWIAKGTLAQAKADRQIALLKAAIAKIEETRSYEEVRRGA